MLPKEVLPKEMRLGMCKLTTEQLPLPPAPPLLLQLQFPRFFLAPSSKGPCVACSLMFFVVSMRRRKSGMEVTSLWQDGEHGGLCAFYC